MRQDRACHPLRVAAARQFLAAPERMIIGRRIPLVVEIVQQRHHTPVRLRLRRTGVHSRVPPPRPPARACAGSRPRPLRQQLPTRRRGRETFSSLACILLVAAGAALRAPVRARARSPLSPCSVEVIRRQIRGSAQTAASTSEPARSVPPMASTGNPRARSDTAPDLIVARDPIEDFDHRPDLDLEPVSSRISRASADSASRLSRPRRPAGSTRRQRFEPPPNQHHGRAHHRRSPRRHRQRAIGICRFTLLLLASRFVFRFDRASVHR